MKICQMNKLLLLHYYQRLDEENEKEATLKLKLQLTMRKNNLDRRFADSQELLSDANMAVELASDMYKKL